MIQKNIPLTVENWTGAEWWDGIPDDLEPEQIQFLEALAQYEKEHKS